MPPTRGGKAMQEHGFMELTCPASAGRNTWPIIGTTESAAGLGKRLPKTGNVFRFSVPAGCRQRSGRITDIRRPTSVMVRLADLQAGLVEGPGCAISRHRLS